MTSQDTISEQRGFQYKHGDRPLEGFTIQRAAGRGGFGEVYYGISDGGREVALKLIHTYEQIELRGISHCMNLKSPHLVTIFDVKYGLDGRPWVIMEFVSGPSLRELIDAAPSGLGAQKAAFFLREIAKSLTYLHDCGIVHRDLKPGNIFYENGYVKIGDYGLSKAILGGQNSGQTITVGTVHYMAPEIGEGHYDKGIDLYALGALLYEMLTGQVPFFGASPTEVLMKHLNAPVDLTNIEEPFATVIRKAMAKNPADRYQSAQEMVEAVFGAEHVRNSVSHFAPESLSIVAGHVVRKLTAEPSYAGSSSVTSQPNRDVIGQLGQRMHRLMNFGMEAAMKPCRKIGRRLDRFMGEPVAGANEAAGRQGGARDVEALPGAAAIVDPISARQRRALAAVAIGLVAVGCGIAGPSSNAPKSALFAMLAIVGGTIGVMIGIRRIAPGLPPEPKYLFKLAVGGFAGLCAVACSLPLATHASGMSSRMNESWLAILLSVFLIDWKIRTRVDRCARVDFERIIAALVLGAILGAILDASAALVGGIAAGISLAVQIISPWIGGAVKPGSEKNAGLQNTLSSNAPLSSGFVTEEPIGPQSAGVVIGALAAPGAIATASQALRPVSRFARVTWLIFFIGFATLCLFLLGMLIAGVSHDDDEQAAMLGFAIPSALFAVLCMNRSATPAFLSYWPYLFRPVLQIACIGSIAVSLSELLIGGVVRSDMPIALFFIVFPAVALLVLTFLDRTGGNMSQVASSTTIPPQAVEGGDDGFFLSRIVGGAGRFLGSALASVFLIAAVLLGLAASADLPGLLNSNLVSPVVHRDMERVFGNADWPRLLRTLGWVASVILSIAAVAVSMQVRKRAGTVHMLRALASVVLFFASILILGRALPAWADLVPANNGWELADQYLKHISNPAALRAAGPLLAAILLLLWPAGRLGKAKSSAPVQEAK